MLLDLKATFLIRATLHLVCIAVNCVSKQFWKVNSATINVTVDITKVARPEQIDTSAAAAKQ